MLRKEVNPERKPRGRIGRKLVVTFVFFVLSVIGGTGWAFHDLTQRSLDRQMSERLLAVARLVAGGLDGDLVRRLRPGDEGFRVYGILTNRLRTAKEEVGARRIYVFDRQGRSLLDTEQGTPVGREFARLRFQRAELSSLWKGQAAHSILFQGEDGVFYKSGYAPVFIDGEVVAGVGVDIGAAFLETIQAFQRSILIFGGISVALTVVIGLVLARSITLPIHRLVEAARDIGRGNLKREVDTSSRDELGYLGKSMEEMRRKILARDAQLRQMLGGVAHEIRNPLGGIEIYAGLIADDLPDEDPRKTHIRKVIGEVKTLNRIITEFLDFARPTQPRPEAASVSRLAEETAFLLGPEMETVGVRYEQVVPGDLRIKADSEQVKRSLLNLMKNGIQAMQDGGSLTLKARESGDRVVIEVSDTGSGMTPEVRGRLFEPFFTTKQKGAGLGLAMVQKISEENGGWVEVETEAGKGTVFRLTLPRAEDNRGQMPGDGD